MRILFSPHYSGHPISLSAYRARSSLPLDAYGSLGGFSTDEPFVTKNNGNMIHAESAAKIFHCDRNLSTVGRLPSFSENEDYSSKVKNIEDNFDFFVLNYANIIRDVETLGDRAEQLSRELDSTRRLLEAVNTPFAVLGMGLQDEIPVNKDRILPALLKLLEVMERKASLIGVRGTRTEKFLNGIGVHKAVALGCPSLFVNPWAIERMKAVPIDAQSRVTSAGRLQRSKSTVHRMKPLLNIAAHFDTDFTFQNDIFNFARDHNFDDLPYNADSGEIDKDCCDAIVKSITGRISPYRKYWFFRTPSAWRSYAATRSVYLGDRFHGGVAFLQAGRPAGFIYDDLRVQELTGFFGLPQFTPEEAVDMDPVDLLGAIVSEKAVSEFKDIYAERKKSFVHHCAAAGLVPKFA